MSFPATADDFAVGRPADRAAGLPARMRFWLQAAMAQRPETSGKPSAPEKIDDACRADWQDVRSSLGGDEAGFERLVHRYQQPIAAYMWRFTRDRNCWEELVQEVFVEAYFSLGSYRAKAPLLHWLKKIATRTGYRWWKERSRRQRFEPLSVESWDRPVEPDCAERDAAEAAAVVHALLARMSPRDRLVLTLIHLEECSVAETAQLTGWSRTMVKVQAHRARKRLKALLEESEAER